MTNNHVRKVLTEDRTGAAAKVLTEFSKDEQLDGRKKLYMTGVFIEGAVRNYNRRIYPVSEISGAVDLINKQINDGLSMYGEMDHPEELTINIDRISHEITKMWMDGNMGCGKLRILPTPSGEIIRTLIECEGKLGVSSRGSGEVDHNGHVSGFEIVTVDIVVRPSAPSAYPTPVYEAFNSNKRGAIIDGLARVAAEDPRAAKYLKEEVLNWISKLK